MSLYRALNKIASTFTVHVHMYCEVTHFLVTVATVKLIWEIKIGILTYCLLNKGPGIYFIQVSRLTVIIALSYNSEWGFSTPAFVRSGPTPPKNNSIFIQSDPTAVVTGNSNFFL